MEPTRLDSMSFGAPVRLSWAQKGDLLAQSLAAVITTALIAAPVVWPALTAEKPLAARPVAELPLIVAHLDTPSAVPLARMSARPRVARAVVIDGRAAEGGEAAPAIGTSEISESDVAGSTPVSRPPGWPRVSAGRSAAESLRSLPVAARIRCAPSLRCLRSGTKAC